MEKLLASEIIELDEKFIQKIVDRLEVKKMEQTYTVKEVADIVKSNVQTIRRHIEHKILKATKPGGTYIITHTELINYINK